MKISKDKLRYIVGCLEIEGIDYLSHKIQKDWYPEVFREKMNGWYRDTRFEFEKVLVFLEDDRPLYGFAFDGSFNYGLNLRRENKEFMVPASKGTINCHLSTEAKRRGFKEDGTVYHFKSLISGYNVITSYRGPKSRKFDLSETGDLYLGGCVIFHKGQWIEPIETISKEEAEKQLGKKIV